MSMAIKYNLNKKKKSKGDHPVSDTDMVKDHNPPESKADHMDEVKLQHMEKLDAMKSMRGHDRKYLAEGGDVEEDMVSETVKPSPPPKPKKSPAKSMSDAFNKSGQEGGWNTPFAEGGNVCHHCKGSGYMHMAEGGFVATEEASGYEPKPHENPEHHYDHAVENQHDHEDMIKDLMFKRTKMYSKGGRVANDTPPMADSEPNDFDDLALDDHLEEHYTGKNSGDEDGDAQEDHDRKDIVSMIMKSRKKKDRMPHPA